MLTVRSASKSSHSITGDSAMTNHRNTAREQANALEMAMLSTQHNKRGRVSGAIKSDYFHS